MKLHRMVILLASAMAMVAVSMLGAAAAQAEENKGPLWIVGQTTRAVAGLSEGQTRAMTSRTEKAPVLNGGLASVECEKATNTGFLLGGRPGTDYAKITFVKCHLLGHAECVATGLKPLAAANAGEIIVDVLTILGFAKGSRTSAVDIFAPEGEAGSENLFSEFEFKNNVGTTECGALNEVPIKVNSVGSAIKIKSETRNAGAIAKVGRSNGTSFVLSLPGEVSLVGLLILPEKANVIKEAEVYNTATEKYEVIKAKLEAAALATEVVEEAETQIELNPKEEFGWDY